MRKSNYTESQCNFKTKRLMIKSLIENNVEKSQKKKLAKEVLSILTPEVTEFLPDSWQEINSINDSYKWLDERHEESTFLTVRLLLTGELVGLIFLYEPEIQEKYFDLMFGYLFAETSWGKGYATELIKGLVKCCKNTGNIKSLSGGVAIKNVGSVKVLEKCGFKYLKQDSTAGNTMMFKQEFEIRV